MKKVFIIGVFIIFIISMSAFFLLYEQPKELIEENKDDQMYMVSHSEYWSGEEGQIITRLLDYRGVPLVADCYTDIYYPNKTYFVENDSMTFNIESHYYSFITPSVEGVYEYRATCYYAGGVKKRSVMNSFHLSPALNFINISYNSLTEQITNLTNLNEANFNNLTFNLTQIKEDTDYIRANIQTNASAQNILNELEIIQGFCNDLNTSSSNLCQWVNQTRVRLINMNNTIDNYLFVINQTVGVNQGIITLINQTVTEIGDFTDDDRFMLEKIYNCTILGEGCYYSEERVWNYSGRYIHGETN